MVGTKRALAYAVNNVTVTKRNTLLKERLAGNGSNFMEESKVISYLDIMEAKKAEPSKEQNNEQNREQNLNVAEEYNYNIMGAQKMD
jgi:uncharacterized protein with WD repeat